MSESEQKPDETAEQDFPVASDHDEADVVHFDDSTDLDELLNEIGQDDESLLTGDETTAEDSTESEDDDFDELMELPEVDDELDLSMAETADEPGAEESVATTGQQELLPDTDVPELEITEKSMNSDPLAEVAAIAAERNAEAAKQQSAKIGKGIQIALAAVSLLALVVAGFAIWQASSVSSRLDEIATSIQALQQSRGATNTTSRGDVGAVRADLDKLMAQVNEMASTLDGSLVDMQEKNQTALDAMAERLDKLEKREATAPVAAVKPLVEKASSIAQTGASAGAWSVNLISLSNEKVADQELARLRNLGIRAEKQRVEQDGRVWYRLRVPGFTSRDGAKAYIDTVEAKAGVDNAWVGKN
jgi:uncharacterized protein YoxC